MDPNTIGLSQPSVSKRQRNARDKPRRTYAVYARRLDSDQSLAASEGGLGYLLELEYGFDSTLLCEPEGVHGGSEHRGEGEEIDAMVLNRSPSSEVLRGEMLVLFASRAVILVQTVISRGQPPLTSLSLLKTVGTGDNISWLRRIDEGASIDLSRTVICSSSSWASSRISLP